MNSFRTTYQAIEMRGDGATHLVSREIRSPIEDELLIRVDFVGLCATDKEIRDGLMVYFTNGMASYPIVPGHEWVGHVVEAGPKAGGFEAGQRVVGECSIGCNDCNVCATGKYHLCPRRSETGLINQSGGMAEYIYFPARSAHLIPDTVDIQSAALIEPTAVAYNAVKAANLSPEDRVLVVGAGPIGLLAMQIAKAVGASNVGICDVSQKRLEKASVLGADQMLLGSEEHLAAGDWNRIIEATGHPSGLKTALELAAPGATVVCVSLYGTTTVPVDVDRIVTGDIVLKGSLGSPGCWPEAIELVSNGQVHPASLVTRTFPMHQVEEALKLVGTPNELKITLQISEGTKK